MSPLLAVLGVWWGLTRWAREDGGHQVRATGLRYWDPPREDLRAAALERRAVLWRGELCSGGWVWLSVLKEPGAEGGFPRDWGGRGRSEGRGWI